MKNGSVTIPARIRKKYGFEKGSKVDFVETDEGILIVPIIPLAELHGVDKGREKIIFKMIQELQAEHRSEATKE